MLNERCKRLQTVFYLGEISKKGNLHLKADQWVYLGLRIEKELTSKEHNGLFGPMKMV